MYILHRPCDVDLIFAAPGPPGWPQRPPAPAPPRWRPPAASAPWTAARPVPRGRLRRPRVRAANCPVVLICAQIGQLLATASTGTSTRMLITCQGCWQPCCASAGQTWCHRLQLKLLLFKKQHTDGLGELLLQALRAPAVSRARGGRLAQRRIQLRLAQPQRGLERGRLARLVAPRRLEAADQACPLSLERVHSPMLCPASCTCIRGHDPEAVLSRTHLRQQLWKHVRSCVLQSMSCMYGSLCSALTAVCFVGAPAAGAARAPGARCACAAPRLRAARLRAPRPTPPPHLPSARAPPPAASGPRRSAGA